MGCTLAIVTNGVIAAQRGRYNASPIQAYIPHLFISQEVGARTPNPIFLTVSVEGWKLLTGSVRWWWETALVPTSWAAPERGSTRSGTILAAQP